MMTEQANTLEIATLPLGDGRQVAIPLLTLAEVQQYTAGNAADGALGTLHWRGHELPVESLEEFCGLPAQPRENLRTVGIFRAGQASEQPFRALAFSGLAAHRQLQRADMQETELPAEGNFTAAALIGEETLLIPDLPNLLYA